MWLNAPCHAIIFFYWFFVADFVGMTLGKSVEKIFHINVDMHVHKTVGIIVGMSVANVFYLDVDLDVYTDDILDGDSDVCTDVFSTIIPTCIRTVLPTNPFRGFLRRKYRRSRDFHVTYFRRKKRRYGSHL